MSALEIALASADRGSEPAIQFEAKVPETAIRKGALSKLAAAVRRMKKPHDDTDS